MLTTRALGLALGVAADAALGDPRRHHPVAWFGSWASIAEKPLYADSTVRGGIYAAVALAPVAALGCAAERASRVHPIAHLATTALATWAVVGARSLVIEGTTMAEKLHEGELSAAREQLSHLCGRDPRDMAAEDLARATVESLAENTNDAVVCSLFWGAIAGVPGLLVHRGANTLDAMVGHLNDRYRHFGTASAMLDDALAWVPARLTGLLACGVASGVMTVEPDRTVVVANGEEAWRIMCRDHAKHPSPNGGWCESAWAGALGVQLGGTNVYFGRTEERGLLGDGPRPNAGRVRLGAALVGAVTTAATVAAAVGLGAVARGAKLTGRGAR